MLSQMKNKLIKVVSGALVAVFIITAVFVVTPARKAQAFACLVPGPCQFFQGVVDGLQDSLIAYAKKRGIQIMQQKVMDYLQGANADGVPLFITNWQQEIFEVAQKYAYKGIDDWLGTNLCSNIDANLKQNVLRIVQLNLGLNIPAPDCAIVPSRDWNVLKDGWDYYYAQLGDKNQRTTGILASALGISITLQGQKEAENATKGVANKGYKNVEDEFGNIKNWTLKKMEDIKDFIIFDVTNRSVGSFLGSMVGNILTQQLDNAISK